MDKGCFWNPDGIRLHDESVVICSEQDLAIMGRTIALAIAMDTADPPMLCHEGHEDFMARELEARGELINMDFSKLEERVIANLPESAQQKFLDEPYDTLWPTQLAEMERVMTTGRRGYLIPYFLLKKNEGST